MEAWTKKLDRVRQSCTEHTLVELVGRRRLLIEGHRGVRGYSREEILVGTDYGVLRIAGADLCLCGMSREQLLIRGTVYALVPEGSGT